MTQDCPPYMLTTGLPPKVYGPNSIGLRRAGVEADVRGHIKQAHKLLFRSGKALSNGIESVRAEIPVGPEIEHLLAFCENSNRGVTAG